MSKIVFTKVDNKAEIPTRTNEYFGYDITAISIAKKISNNITIYDTGIKIFPVDGFYFELIPKSSLSNTGYILSNSTCIYPEYSENLLISLTKVDNDMQDIELPFKLCQLVIKKIERFDLFQMDETDKSIRPV